MEAATRLDYVHFQLTPTRTRCDLVIFSGESSERLAYGLLDPFLSHLHAAKDQISKGGYSITLRPPSNASAGNNSWFTKATLQRFVRFVSTPEVLERFVTIEKEIEHIESSVRSYEAASNAGDTKDAETEGSVSLTNGNSKHDAASQKLKGESGGNSDAVKEESSKLRLQCVLETRKAVLQKEQAMAFARALAAGFEMDNLGDLLPFSDAFGASRLREACMSFMALCKRKNEDRLWRDEVAAMQAFPPPQLAYTGTCGIILAGEDKESTQNFMSAAHIGSISCGNLSGPTDLSLSNSTASHGSSDINSPDNSITTAAQVSSNIGNAQVPIPWPNVPQHLHNFQGSIYQQMPPYQGYVYPGMPYFPSNLQWPPNVKDTTPAVDREADGPSNRKSSSSKKKKKNQTSRISEPQNEDLKDDSEPSDSSSESDSSVKRQQRKKHGKKSLKKVVICNINYIASRDGEKAAASEEDSSGENDFLATDNLRQQLEKDVHRKRNKHLVSNDSLTSSVDHVSESEFLKSDVDKSGNGNWDFLQELLIKEDPDSNSSEHQRVQVDAEYLATKRPKEPKVPSFYLQPEETRKQKPISVDSFLVADKEMDSDGNLGRSCFNFEASDGTRLIPKGGSMHEEFLQSQGHEEKHIFQPLIPSDCAAQTSLEKICASDDWIVGKGSEKATNGEESLDLGIIDGNYSSPSPVHTRNKKEVNVDSLMIQVRSMDDSFESQLRTDIGMLPDILGASVAGYGSSEVRHGKSESVGFYEPNDLCMVLDRDAVVEQTVIPLSLEIDYETSKSMNEADRNHLAGDGCADPAFIFDGKATANGKTRIPKAKASTKDARAKGLGGSSGKPEIIPRNRKPTLGIRTTLFQNRKLDQEEEDRKRKEELLLQRQKRIAERNAGMGQSLETPKKPQNKAIPASNTLVKPKGQPSLVEGSNRVTKSVFMHSTFERLAATRSTQKVSAVSLNSGLPKKEPSKVNGANAGRGLPEEMSTWKSTKKSTL